MPPAPESLLVLPLDWMTMSELVVECPTCKGLYATKANGQMRKHKCIVPLSVLPTSMLISKDEDRPLLLASPLECGSASSPPGVVRRARPFTRVLGQ